MKPASVLSRSLHCHILLVLQKPCMLLQYWTWSCNSEEWEQRSWRATGASSSAKLCVETCDHGDSPRTPRRHDMSPFFCQGSLLSLQSEKITSRARQETEKKTIEDNFAIKELGTKNILTLSYCPCSLRAM